MKYILGTGTILRVQGWDEKDWRLQRFDTAPKMVNPNVAATLIAQKPPKDCGHDSVVYCDGGHAALGHPKVYRDSLIFRYHFLLRCSSIWTNRVFMLAVIVAIDSTIHILHRIPICSLTISIARLLTVEHIKEFIFYSHIIKHQQLYTCLMN